jgi:hypothetical protein
VAGLSWCLAALAPLGRARSPEAGRAKRGTIRHSWDTCDEVRNHPAQCGTGGSDQSGVEGGELARGHANDSGSADQPVEENGPPMIVSEMKIINTPKAP